MHFVVFVNAWMNCGLVNRRWSCGRDCWIFCRYVNLTDILFWFSFHIYSSELTIQLNVCVCVHMRNVDKQLFILQIYSFFGTRTEDFSFCLSSSCFLRRIWRHTTSYEFHWFELGQSIIWWMENLCIFVRENLLKNNDLNIDALIMITKIMPLIRHRQ